MGSSIIRDAFLEARHRPGGPNLCLPNTSIWWQGRGGMKASQLRGQILTMLQYEDPPQYLLIHVGANDIGETRTDDLREYLKNVVTDMSDTLSNTQIIWSQMLPRKQWRYSLDNVAMEKSRYRVNNSVASYNLKIGGLYIRYPEIHKNCNLFKPDGVHLKPVGCQILLNILQGGLEQFMQNGGTVFPSN